MCTAAGKGLPTSGPWGGGSAWHRVWGHCASEGRYRRVEWPSSSPHLPCLSGPLIHTTQEDCQPHQGQRLVPEGLEWGGLDSVFLMGSGSGWPRAASWLCSVDPGGGGLPWVQGRRQGDGGGCWPDLGRGHEEETGASLRVWRLWATLPCVPSFPPHVPHRLPRRRDTHQAIVDVV